MFSLICCFMVKMHYLLWALVYKISISGVSDFRVSGGPPVFGYTMGLDRPMEYGSARTKCGKNIPWVSKNNRNKLTLLEQHLSRSVSLLCEGRLIAKLAIGRTRFRLWPIRFQSEVIFFYDGKSRSSKKDPFENGILFCPLRIEICDFNSDFNCTVLYL